MSEKNILSDEARKKKNEYNKERNKQLFADGLIKRFYCTLPTDEADAINKTLKELKMNKVDFIKWAYKKLLEKNK